MFFKQLQRKPVVTLRQRAVTHHVGEHDGGQFALFDVFGRHERIKPERVRKEIPNLPRSSYLLHLSVDLQLASDARVQPRRSPAWQPMREGPADAQRVS